MSKNLSQEPPTSSTESSIIIRQNGPFNLVKTSNKITIVYHARNQQDLILCESEHEFDLMINRYDCLMDIINTISMDLYRPKTVQFFKKLLETMFQHPNWLNVHLAAYYDLVDYFKRKSFTSEEISKQTLPDNYTPLHLAVKQQLRSTIDRILHFNPNIKLVDIDNNTIIHLAAMASVDIFKSLFNHHQMKSLLTAKNNDGLNAIQLICMNSRKEHLIHLMKLGLTARQLSIVSRKDEDFLLEINDNQIVHFHESDLASMDLNRIHCGGCPLHWATKPEIMKRLLCYFHIETPNLNGENALMTMVDHNQFQCALMLMYNGSNMNKINLNGNTALHMAVKRSNALMVKALIIFDSDINIKNNNGLTAHQMAIIDNKRPIIELFQTYFEKRKNIYPLNEDNNGETIPGCTLPNEFVFPKKIPINKDECLQNSSHISRIICFDGGGVKGLFTVQVLIELQKYLKQEVINYFDWVAGTSTGSMIAFALINKKSLTEIRKLYFIFKNEILTGNRPYSTENLVNLFKVQLEADFPLRDVWNVHRKHLIITATRIDCYPPTLQLFCSHGCSSQHNQTYPQNFSVWQALRASCAAPTYFHDYRPYVDGGLISNNPTLDAITEFFRYHQNLKSNMAPPTLELVLSFGTGRSLSKHDDFSNIFNKLNYFLDIKSWFRDLNLNRRLGNELISQMKTQVTNCNDHIVNRTVNWLSCLNIMFLRLNATCSIRVSLNESNDEQLILALWDVKLYCYQMENYFKKISQVLDQK